MLNRQVGSLGMLVQALGLLLREENYITREDNHMRNKPSTIACAVAALLMLGFGASTITADEQAELKGEMAEKGKYKKLS